MLGKLGKTALLSGIAATCLGAAVAQDVQQPSEGDGQIPTVFVWGLRENTIGQALTASEGVVGFARYQDRPILRAGEVLEVVPGLATTQHSGTGKANQYFLRGFNIDHGTDFSASLDGVPLNLPTHAHGQGYLDLNVVTPELIETIHYKKGTYFADTGDFSAAGSAAMETFEHPQSAFVQVGAGENNYGRLLAVTPLGEHSSLAVDLTGSDGPWLNSEKLRKYNIYGHFALGDWAVNAVAYDARWNSTDQIPERAVLAGTLNRLGTIDATDGGKTSRYILSLRNRDVEGWDIVGYAQKYKLNLFSNFTYFLDDPVNGDQFEQADERWIFGGSAVKTWPGLWSGWALTTGASFRNDAIDTVGLYRTTARARSATVREDDVNEWSAAAYASAQRAFGPLRANLGLRVDAIGVDVTSDNALNSGNAAEGFVSPKATLAYRVAPDLEFYAGAGRGFHSNDARGATISVDPNTGLPEDRVGLFAGAWGSELGVRWQRETFSATATAWYLKLDSELVYTGDAGDTESSDATRRFGGEILFDWRPVPGINIDASAAATDARYLGNPAAGSRIPNAITYMLSGGVSAAITEGLVGTLTVRHLGPAPLIEDNSVRSNSATATNALLRYTIGNITLSGEILNLFDSNDDDIRYFYTSRLPGEAAAGVDDFHIHPMEPRTFRVSVRWNFD
jgi:hypothetical protein